MRWGGGKGERLVRWEGGEGGRVVRWQGGKGGKVVRWQGGNGGRMVSQKGGRYQVLFKGGGHKMTPRFHLLILIKETKGCDGFKIFLRGRRDGSFASC